MRSFFLVCGQLVGLQKIDQLIRTSSEGVYDAAINFINNNNDMPCSQHYCCIYQLYSRNNTATIKKSSASAPGAILS